MATGKDESRSSLMKSLLNTHSEENNRINLRYGRKSEDEFQLVNQEEKLKDIQKNVMKSINRNVAMQQKKKLEAIKHQMELETKQKKQLMS